MNQAIATCSIQIINDISVTVPESLQLMTPYVLHEQNDWFEDEIKFLRTFIKPGMQVIDIGANYGLYTLTIAKTIGEEGKIWAFEPTTTTSDCLKKSIIANNFNNIELIQAGLSNRIREAEFFIGPNSELNSLSNEFVSGGMLETISLLTLDHCAENYGWRNIDFIKLDAEGEESKILRKGKHFLTSESPLIMFELKHGNNVNLTLISRFKNLGYDTYRLVPGLNTLVPFNSSEPFDGFLLNLFGCKHDKAAFLESEGVVVKDWEQIDCPPDTKVITEFFDKMPCGGFFTNNINIDDASKDYLSILTMYILAQSEETATDLKVGYLFTALNCIRNMLNNGQQSLERLTTFARIAFDAGERSLGVGILSSLINKYDNNKDFILTEPVLPASSKYDTIDPKENINEWVFSSILEQYIIKHAYSSYFTKSKSSPMLEKLRSLGFMDDNMRKREELLKSCFNS